MGVEALTAGIAELLPATAGDPDAPLSGTVFKVERGPAGEKVAYARLFSGTVHVRDRLHVQRADHQTAGREAEPKVTAIRVFEDGAAVQRQAVTAGQIGKLWGLADVRIGDALGAASASSNGHYFAPPTLESVVVPRRPAENGALHAALAQLAEQDPLIDLRQDDVRHEIAVSLYGEVQKEVIQATLATEYGLDVDFRETTTICVERPSGTGEAVELIRTAPNPFLATVGLRVEPAPVDSGPRFEIGGDVTGTMPFAFFKAVEETVLETLRQGLYGWQVTDCLVTMTQTGYSPRQSHAHQRFNKSMSSTGADFRGLTPLVLMAALKRAGTTVYEPMHRFRLEIPPDTLGVVAPALARLQAVPETQDTRGSSSVLEGRIPAARVHDLQQQLPTLTRGEGILESTFDRYQPVAGTIPTRPRTDHNPLNRKEYLLHVTRRV